MYCIGGEDAVVSVVVGVGSSPKFAIEADNGNPGVSTSITYNKLINLCFWTDQIE